MSDQDFAARDLEMISSPEKWPMYPLLPLKHRAESGDLFVGFLATTSFVGWGKTLGEMLLIEADVFDQPSWASAPRIHINSPQQVLDLGWEVD